MKSASIATITLKTTRPHEVARFWRDLLGYHVAPNHSDSVLLVGDADAPALLVQPARDEPGQGAIHLDLRPDDAGACRDRALFLGATEAHIGQSGDEGWTVLADPAGNLFCILDSAAEHEKLLDAEPGTPTPLSALVVLSGRPGTGKTTIAREVSRHLNACYLRVDAAETALARTGADVGAGGYAVVHELAVSNLLLGSTVVVDAVSPVPEARASWREAAERAGVELVSFEIVLPDGEEHRRRVETRAADIPGHEVPTWEEVQLGEWTSWDEPRDGRRLVIDSTDTTAAVDRVVAAIRAGSG